MTYRQEPSLPDNTQWTERIESTWQSRAFRRSIVSANHSVIPENWSSSQSTFNPASHHSLSVLHSHRPTHKHKGIATCRRLGNGTHARRRLPTPPSPASPPAPPLPPCRSVRAPSQTWNRTVWLVTVNGSNIGCRFWGAKNSRVWVEILMVVFIGLMDGVDSVCFRFLKELRRFYVGWLTWNVTIYVGT